MSKVNRRNFMAGSAMSFAGATGMLGKLAGSNAWAANVTSPYKALVCVYLGGGMDHADTIIPKDQESYNKLRSARRELLEKHYRIDKADSSRNIKNLLELNPLNAREFNGRKFGMPPNMSGIRDMFNNGEAAIIGNVGTLIEPTDRESYERQLVPLPAHLFSHNDQEATWLSLGTEGGTTGWGGLFADKILDSDPTADPVYTAITADQNTIFLAGKKARKFRATSQKKLGLSIADRSTYLSKINNDDAVRNKIEAFFEENDFGHENIFSRDMSNAYANGIQRSKNYSDTNERERSVITTKFPNGKLGQQMETTARTIELRNALGDYPINRQVFFVSLGGFDTHDEQAGRLPELQSEINDSMVAFRSAMEELGMWEDVTVFTASDFGRTTTGNGDGTDHGWGNHHFIMGGSVKGQRVYGELPAYNLNDNMFAVKKGRLIPSLAVEQYAATLGKWFGLNPEELNDVFPLLKNFSTSDLGFMK